VSIEDILSVVVVFNATSAKLARSCCYQSVYRRFDADIEFGNGVC
jgi:hypothetical protein